MGAPAVGKTVCVVIDIHGAFEFRIAPPHIETTEPEKEKRFDKAHQWLLLWSSGIQRQLRLTESTESRAEFVNHLVPEVGCRRQRYASPEAIRGLPKL